MTTASGQDERSANRSTFLAEFSAAIIVGLAAGIALLVFWSFHTYHLDDWNYLGYIAELNGVDPNLNDPFMGTEEDVQSRLAYNVSTWTFYGVSELLGEDPVYVYHSIAPPVLIVGSVVAVFFMLRAATFTAPLAALGSLVWVLYFLASSSGGRSPGTFFFDRIAQDKALAWLICSPLQLGLLFLLLRRLDESEQIDWTRQPGKLLINLARLGRQVWLPLTAFALVTVLATFVHPLGALFGGVLLAAAVLRDVWRRASWPAPGLLVLGAVALVPALISALALRIVAPTEAAGAFRTNGPAIGLTGVRLENFGLAHIVEIGPTFVADPVFIALLNFPALLWVAYGLFINRRTIAITFAAALYVVTAVSYIPGLPALIAPLTTTIAIWRLTWVMAIAFTLAGADFCQWVTGSPQTVARAIAISAGGLTVAGALFLLSLNWDTLTGLEGRGEPDDEKRFIMSELERVFAGSSEVTVLADDTLSLYIPAYTSDISVVGYPRLDTLKDLRIDGRSRRRANEAVASAIDTRGVRREMEFWGADFLVLSDKNLLFYQSTIHDFETCYSTTYFKVLALRSSGGCPEGLGDPSR
ncbi:MAG TPA: hypothetical protein VFZ12_03290 [Dehalococcoidia bacterium]|nr:hypothetical protein [Dehalococcoidia bacterium]